MHPAVTQQHLNAAPHLCIALVFKHFQHIIYFLQPPRWNSLGLAAWYFSNKNQHSPNPHNWLLTTAVWTQFKPYIYNNNNKHLHVHLKICSYFFLALGVMHSMRNATRLLSCLNHRIWHNLCHNCVVSRIYYNSFSNDKISNYFCNV